MLRKVELKKKRIDSYAPVIGEEAVSRIRSLAGPIAGARVLHVNTTGEGGGVAELLTSLAPLMNDVGVQADGGSCVTTIPSSRSPRAFTTRFRASPFDSPMNTESDTYGETAPARA